MVGVLLLLIILGFALTGYLLPWDQKAYWATTVTINIARSVPFAGDFLSGLLKGGTDLGALTLMRWYAAHVFLLPACLIAFTVAHLYLMRRHGISGPVKAVPGPPDAVLSLSRAERHDRRRGGLRPAPVAGDSASTHRSTRLPTPPTPRMSRGPSGTS